MASRLIIGVLALTCGSVSGLLSTMTMLQMVDEVNEQLQKEDQFAHAGWYWSKRRALHREYKRLYPSGPLARKERVLGGFMLACVLVCAWALGFFG